MKRNVFVFGNCKRSDFSKILQKIGEIRPLNLREFYGFTTLPRMSA
ncbi:hypothetical protein appser12_19540 [Actinobacillus pleuropneumoniae serovar 12 str. 1096]|uniref:Uncharacterized protein n=1 Tax=Actinobacillus pleuropneumoniae serovar 6 str. Femo TaxID=754256 RepID=A0A828PQ69_ACTPL|nr:hypothetical protein appser4_19470 [Actinobacillus pleuropneumoniae serovar 4 str. M62]EFM90887.1 hypothetical protein appser6_20950 [Actinobacillus pleuropneumoniae serovar 6 str. Femo]EFM99622.1 hypothetical protein appser12_19540 [Actinobacillus pleuropneumoniae serovar 12 str. 1096]EFN01802.1 hypothetical protein appser13_20090 [Actinobacillus pleuropneumoniae serovar 13 str. N273]